MERRRSRSAARPPGARRPTWTLPRALAGSVVVHVVLAWLFFSGRTPRPTPPAQLSGAAELAIEVEVTTAIALPDPVAGPARATTAAPVPAVPAATGQRGAKVTAPVAGLAAADDNPRSVAAVAAASSAGAPAGAETPVGTADRLATFRPAHPDLEARVGWAAPEPAPRDLLAAPTPKQGGGEPAPGLARTIAGPGDVTATVSEDGTIGFHTPAPIRPNRLPVYSYRDGRGDAHGPPDDPAGLTKRRSPFLPSGEGVMAGLSGRLDVTELVMKMAGQDPHASAKRALAEDTREERQCMAKRVRGDRLKQALFDLATQVRQVTARVDLSAAKRRQLVFEIWDECAEEGDTSDYGQMARATVVSIVRQAFPAGSDEAYRPAELLALNERRTSRQRFAPYEPSALPHHAHQPDGGLPQ